MRKNIIFSSLTGNTKKVAYEILKSMPEGTEIYELKEVAHDVEADLLVLGYWVDRAKPNKEMYKFMEGLKGKKIITFGTLGAYPDSEHGSETKKNVTALLGENNELLGNFLCQGRIDPKLTEMFKKMGNKGPHVMTPKRMKMHKESEKHPNEDDFNNARAFVKAILTNL